MGILSRYILRTHVGPFLFGTLTVMFLLIFQFVLKYIDQLVGKGLSEWVIIQLIAINTAWMVVLAVPMGVLFSTLMAFGSMSSAHEVTIMKASGSSLYKMMFPVIISGFLISLFVFWFNDAVLPEANHHAKNLMNDIRRKKPTFSIDGGQFSSQLDGYTILARSVDSLSGLLKGVTIYDNTRKNESLNIINADSGIVRFNESYTRIIMDLTNGEIHQYFPFIINNYKVVKFDKYQVQMETSGFNFERTNDNMSSRSDRELSINDMRKIVDNADSNAQVASVRMNKTLNDNIDYLLLGIIAVEPEKNQNSNLNMKDRLSNPRQDTVAAKLAQMRADSVKETEEKRRTNVQESNQDQKKLDAYGTVERKIEFLKTRINSDAFILKDMNEKIQQYEVEIYKKYAMPFACLIFVFVGCPLGVISRRGNFGISAGISLGFYIFYWACLIGGEKLADRGIISPFLSMWLGNILIGILGMILTFKVKNETLSIPLPQFIKRYFKKYKNQSVLKTTKLEHGEIG